MKYADGIDNNNDGAVDEFIDEGIDVMIDESRNNGLDDDWDWNPATDDVGLDGLADTGDPGEGDGKPTSGARFGLPGEPGVDVTDVSETDQIGITGSFYRPSSEGLTDQYTDEFVWSNFMVPGNFFDPAGTVAGEYNLFISSGLFPLMPGQEEPISMAIILANGPIQDPNGQIRKNAVLNKKVRAQETYNNDYQFANAPLAPSVTAVTGDNRVTLYWDATAESSFDRYINNIGGNGNDFEGYRIYRASDPAFLDAKIITNAQGVPTFLEPIKIFDLEDGIMGYDSVGFEGVHYRLSENLSAESGIQHSWVDSTVQNGFTYYYAVTSYDFGYPAGKIAPSESDISINLNPDGSVKTLGKNVVRVKPEAPAAGYVPPTLGTIDRVEGFTSSQVFYQIVDPNNIKEGHVYYITFEDTIKRGTADTLTTKNYTLFDSTANVTVIDKGSRWGANVEGPIVDGFKLTLINESRVTLNEDASGWSDPTITPFVFEKFVDRPQYPQGQERPNDYIIVFGDQGFGTSHDFSFNGNLYPSKPVNFKVFNKSRGEFIETGFIEVDTTGASPTGWFSASGSRQDRIIFLETNDGDDSLFPTWWFYLARQATTLPQPGDSVNLSLLKPFLSSDVFRFVAKKGFVDEAQAKADLENVKVVPNPYLANALWEIRNPYSSGRGPRDIHFTHLPNNCTIKIFTVNGELVKEIVHESTVTDGTASWDLLTKDNLSVSYGVYIYHIDAPGIGEKVGKFAIIK
jgi:hypothetical protein